MFRLNLNVYRNAHFRTLAAAKVNFKAWFYETYGSCKGPPTTDCELEYTIYFPDNRAADVANVGSIVDKFASDCLTEMGYIQDDNRKVVKSVKYVDGGIDRDNPRAELIVKTNGKYDYAD